MSWAGLAGDGILLWPSEKESERFGCTISRLVVGRDTIPGDSLERDIARTLASADADMVVARWPGEDVRLAAASLRSGRVILPTDSLTYWTVPAASLAQIPAGDGLDTTIPERATAEALVTLETVITDSFRGYGSHYSANPLLDDGLALAGYVEWAQTAFVSSPENVILLSQGAAPIGVATLTRDSTTLEVELAGLIESAQGGGRYSTLLGAVGRHAANIGCSEVIISTQVHNTRVQRAWVRTGFKPFANVTTVHAMRPTMWEGLPTPPRAALH